MAEKFSQLSAPRNQRRDWQKGSVGKGALFQDIYPHGRRRKPTPHRLLPEFHRYAMACLPINICTCMHIKQNIIKYFFTS